MQTLLERIEIRPDVMIGKPVIRGTRLTVQFILELLASGATENEIIGEYDGLTHEDIAACLAFGARAVESAAFLPLAA